MKNALLNEKGMLVAQPVLFFAVNEDDENTGKRNKGRQRQNLFAMKLLLLLTCGSCFTMYGNGFSQSITLSLKNASLEKAFTAIEQQSNYHFIYTKEELQKGRAVSIEIKNAGIATVLDMCLKEQPLSYSIREPYIIIKVKDESPLPQTAINPATVISGKVTNEQGEAVAGATISIKGSSIATVSNEKGEWRLSFEGSYATLIVTHVSYTSEEIAIKGRSIINISLQTTISSLDETLVIAYGNTTRRLYTGNVAKITAAEISKQPVSNPIAAMQGRVPGLVITQTSGVTGSAFTIELRGRTSLDLALSKNDPLIIIDGVPFEQGNQSSSQINSAVNNPRSINEGGISPLNTLNPSDIESIEILKDADATAIYGSRGASGVILITTKKGKPGKIKVNAGFYSGFSRVTRTMDLLNTQQYVTVRKEAFANDGIIPNITNAPDIMLWDTTRYTDLKKLLIGRKAYNSDAQLSLSGGNSNTQFFIGGGYHYESNVFSKNLSDRRGSMRFNINHLSPDKKFSLNLGGSFSSDKDQLINTDLTSYLNLPPNVLLFDSAGNLSWQEKGVSFPGLNPFAEFERKYHSLNENLQGNLLIGYRVLKDLAIRINVGYNQFTSEETAINPRTAISPGSGSLASSSFANGKNRSWIAEPQAEFKKTAGKLFLTILGGASLQERKSSSETITASNYTNDLLLYSVSAAGSLSVANNFQQYRYTAIFGRASIIYDGKYLFNLSGRGDGSSRFGPGRRFANFGAAGAGWIFSKEKWVKDRLAFLSFGKLRMSYGVTGNDQIGDYKYLNLWSSTTFTYQGMPGYRPSSLFNPDYNWERNKKFEAAIELGFLKERIYFSASYYRNRSNNQLINYKLPSQTGFISVTKNFDALVQNSGLELVLTTKIINHKTFSWTCDFNLTLPKNKLIDFPGLAQSSYVNSYVIGKPLSIIKRYKYLGVNPATGIYSFEDLNGDGMLTVADYQALGNLDPRFYGGLQQQLSYKGFQLTLFVEFKKQTGRNYLFYQRNYFPGSPNNQPLLILNRWQKAGDVAAIQTFTSNASSPAGGPGALRLGSSDGIYADASFARLKNVSLAYELPAPALRRFHCEGMRIYMNAQNLLTITHYKGSDPETQNFYQLPPLRTIVFGLNLNF